MRFILNTSSISIRKYSNIIHLTRARQLMRRRGLTCCISATHPYLLNSCLTTPRRTSFLSFLEHLIEPSEETLIDNGEVFTIMTSRNFYLNAFGVQEDRNYIDAQSTLLSGATFTDKSATVLVAPLHRDYSQNKNDPYACDKASSDEESVMAPPPPHKKVTITKEHCEVRGKLRVVNCGTFWTPSVEELRAEVTQRLQDPEVIALLKPFREAAASSASGANCNIKVGHTIGDSREMHSQRQYRGSVFQAASQFNYLEFPSPGNIPENGITAYIYDRTQGPACAIACAAGTAYRNYLGVVDTALLRLGAATSGKRGQRAGLQFNGLVDVEDSLGPRNTFFDVKNGYVDSDKERLAALNVQLCAQKGQFDLETKRVEDLISVLRIGVQQDTEVTDLVAKPDDISGDIPTSKFLVTQTYNSALSVGYSRVGASLWEPLACLVLAGSYEATMLVGILQAVDALQAQAEQRSGYAMTSPGAHPTYPQLATPPTILLTKVGGGVFGNRSQWIITAMERAFKRTSAYGVPLNVLVTHFGSVDQDYTSLRPLY